MRTATLLSTVSALGLGVFALVTAQGPAAGKPAVAAPKLKEGYGDMFLQTNIGSFKLIDGEGRVEVSFTGTLLISQLKGMATPSPSLRKEYEAKGRTVYHGTGRIVIDGSFRGIQWFGTKMNARWTGKGVGRITGEFDNKLETGTYYYATNPTRKYTWSMYGLTIQNPEAVAGGTGTPMERPSGKPGGG